jgi:hypothetical protein
MKTTTATPEALDKILVKHGVPKSNQGTTHPVAEALCAHMARRVEDIQERLLHENDPATLHRLQGAAVELRRWSNYPEELGQRGAIEKHKEFSD